MRAEQPPYEQARDQPAVGHDRDQQEDNGPPVLFHVCSREFDTNGETLHDQNDARKFQGDQVYVSPRIWVNQIGGMRSKYDAAQRCDGSFANIQALLDHGGA
jgi:hypothetical protein